MLQDRIRAVTRETLRGMRRGIEKESLRARPDGALALTPHPAALGSALAHPHITTDFSESQLELITGAHASAEACLEELTRIHQAVYRAIGDELLWAGSMPCGLPEDKSIPIGHYGTSNVGRAKTVYRNGLSWRYGRRMQTISGIHYNWSLPGLGNDEYFALIRNFRRHGWLLFYLFGSSPATCATFVQGRPHALKELRPGTFHLPHATTLRMGRLGYQSDAQASLVVSCNDLASYARTLQQGLTQVYLPYQKIGIREPGARGDGPDTYRQLSTTLLQIENEFYGKIRPKRTIRPGERPLHALRERGVEYVEVRLMDLDPFEPVGINATTMRFLDVFLLHCLLSESPPDTPEEIACVSRNQECVAQRGREPGLKLGCGVGDRSLKEWGEALLAECAPVAAALDSALDGSAYRDSLAYQAEVLRDPAHTPSARVVAKMQRSHNGSYTEFVRALSARHRSVLMAKEFTASEQERFARLADESIEEQRNIEAADTLPFEEYRKNYLAVERLGIPT
ncbi:MAG: glutamate--cysteine ligase [Betaproteobacteria bacterium]|nr:glutamate--cysteine ligase [Betaproteobacteria bacterium]MDH5219638.1 glutamate--cysteine ligase [Betaproteobacteria bacterium]MDH5350026.1 glutamate--cysteine ligase [Betaproteobacteria bacterium]